MTNDNFLRVERDDDAFFDILVFALKKVNLTPETVALLVISQITHLEIHEKTKEVRFFFNTDPVQLQKRINETENISETLH